MARISGTVFRRVLLAALDSAGEQVGMKLRASAFKLRRPSTVLRYFLPSVLFLIFFFCIATSGPLQPSSNASWTQTWLFGGRPPPPPSEAHPIDKLIYAAEDTFQELVSRETRSLAEAAAAYRERRGRHPPPGFKEWYQFAKRRKAIVVEEFWDQIYQDLEPFWALPPTLIRKQALAYEMTISVRNGTATAESEWFWTQIWLSMIQTIQHLLPDMDLPLNAMDEPRIVVPWERMQTYVETALRTKRMDDKSKVISEFQGLSAPGKGIDRATEIPPKNWQGTSERTPVPCLAACRAVRTILTSLTRRTVLAYRAPRVRTRFSGSHHRGNEKLRRQSGNLGRHGRAAYVRRICRQFQPER